MLGGQKFDEIVKRALNTLPDGMAAMPEEVRRNIKQVVQSTLNAMDLVTREEFDVQVNVLRKTRRKLEALEKCVAELGSQKVVEE